MKSELTFLGIHNRVSKCQIEVKGNLVIVTELSDNPGTSVTNAAEIIATEVCKEYHIDPKELIYIEHYPKSTIMNETWDLVKFTVEGRELTNADWKNISKEKVIEITTLAESFKTF